MEGLAWYLPVNLFRFPGWRCCLILMNDTIGVAVGIEGTLKGLVYVCELLGV